MVHSYRLYSIAIVAYPGAQMSAILGLDDLFAIANRFARQHGSTQLAAKQICEPLMYDDPASDSFDAVILPPSLEQYRGREDKKMHAWLRSRHTAGALMCSV